MRPVGETDYLRRERLTTSPHHVRDLLAQIRFDLIFIDTKLPSTNGLGLYLATKKITPPAIAIMADGMEEEFEEIAKEAVRRNAYTLVKKPLDTNHGLGLLQRVTGQRASHDLPKPAPNAS